MISMNKIQTVRTKEWGMKEGLNKMILSKKGIMKPTMTRQYSKSKKRIDPKTVEVTVDTVDNDEEEETVDSERQQLGEVVPPAPISWLCVVQELESN